MIPFLASLKLNFYTYICSSTKQPDGMPRPLLDPKIMELLRRHAMLEPHSWWPIRCLLLRTT